jgi:predicted Rossmann fold nucleotide-binding protein DprA/Smf involved in DNA uptake
MAEPTDGLDPASQATLAVLDGQAREVDHIARHCGLNEDDTLAALTELELAGLAVCEAGGRWVRVGPAGR